MKLKLHAKTFAGELYSLNFSEKKLFQMFSSFVQDNNLKAKNIFYLEKQFSSFSKISSSYLPNSEILIIPENLEAFLKGYAKFHNEHNSECARLS